MHRVVLISTYELGRQPFGLASPAAWLAAAGAAVSTQDLAVSDFDEDAIRDAAMVGVYVPMHTATRMAAPILSRIRAISPTTHICAYGLYASMNADYLRDCGADSIIGGEFEEPLVDLYRSLNGVSTPDGRQHNTHRRSQNGIASGVYLQRQEFLVPHRADLPELGRYAALRLPSGTERTVGYTEATRGCKHLCRHCPIVPVYGGRFRVVQADTVLGDVRQQVAAGAEHITFGDPDFFNAPAHAMRVVAGLHSEFPHLSYDVTIKVEHLRRHAHLAPALKDTGCVLVTTAVESVDDDILSRLDKQHTADDLDFVLRLLRDLDLALNPTFVAFTPWTTLAGYGTFLAKVLELDLVDSISPVQYGIRLLIPAGSRILELADVRPLLRDFDPTQLAYPWFNPDPRVDQLQQRILDIVRAEQSVGSSRRDIFAQVWRATGALRHPEGANESPDFRRLPVSAEPPQLTEQWYCCAEPTDEQLAHL